MVALEMLDHGSFFSLLSLDRIDSRSEIDTLVPLDALPEGNPAKAESNPDNAASRVSFDMFVIFANSFLTYAKASSESMKERFDAFDKFKTKGNCGKGECAIWDVLDDTLELLSGKSVPIAS